MLACAARTRPTFLASHFQNTMNSHDAPTAPQPRCFRIVRFYHPSLGRRSRTIRNGLTEAEAQAHCSRMDTRKPGVYFDGYDYMKGCRP